MSGDESVPEIPMPQVASQAQRRTLFSSQQLYQSKQHSTAVSMVLNSTPHISMLDKHGVLYFPMYLIIMYSARLKSPRARSYSSSDPSSRSSLNDVMTYANPEYTVHTQENQSEE
jgi:hypothetical protein